MAMLLLHLRHQCPLCLCLQLAAPALLMDLHGRKMMIMMMMGLMTSTVATPLLYTCPSPGGLPLSHRCSIDSTSREEKARQNRLTLNQNTTWIHGTRFTGLGLPRHRTGTDYRWRRLCITSRGRWSVTWSSERVRSSRWSLAWRRKRIGGRENWRTGWGFSLLITSNSCESEFSCFQVVVVLCCTKMVTILL